VFSLQEEDARTLAANWFQLLMVLFTKEYLPTFFLCFLVLIFRLWSSLLSMVLEVYSLSLSKPSPDVCSPSPGVCICMYVGTYMHPRWKPLHPPSSWSGQGHAFVLFSFVLKVLIYSAPFPVCIAQRW